MRATKGQGWSRVGQGKAARGVLGKREHRIRLLWFREAPEQMHSKAQAGCYICNPTKMGRKMLCCRETTKSQSKFR